MSHATPSALVTDKGEILFRLEGRFFQLSQQDLRSALDLPPGPAGVGITIDKSRFRFEFPGDNRSIDITAKQLGRRLAKQTTAK